MTSDSVKKPDGRHGARKNTLGLIVNIPSIYVSGPASELRLPGQDQQGQQQSNSFQSTSINNRNDSPPRLLSSPSIYFSIQEGNNRNFNNELNTSISSVREVVDMDSVDDGSCENVSTSAILNYCKMKVLRPYFRLLSILGWRPLLNQATLFENNLWVRIINCIYTALIIALILIGYLLQYSCCYRQDGYKPYTSETRVDPVLIPTTTLPSTTSLFHFIGSREDGKHNQGDKRNQTENDIQTTTQSLLDGLIPNDLYSSWSERREIERRREAFGSSLETNDSSGNQNPPKAPVVLDTSLKCRGNLFALYLIPNILHFLAYLFILHLMRTPDCERLENLMERGFLQTTRTTGWVMAHRKLINSLRSFLWICLVWLFLSFTIHGLMVGSRVYNGTLDFRWIQPPKPFFVPIVALTIVSMTFNDFICGSIATSYAVHCQLNISYIINLCASIREKRVDFQVTFFTSLYNSFYNELPPLSPSHRLLLSLWLCHLIHEKIGEYLNCILFRSFTNE